MMTTSKTTFALFFGNRGFFPASLQKSARQELSESLRKLGHKVLMLDEKATRYGAVETAADGQVYAEFLRRHAGKFGGIILCLPNFGDENGAVEALRDANVPILIQAYPDELDKMAPAFRRDSFCGKFSIMDVFVQNSIPFTIRPPHTVHPLSEKFAEQVDYFDRLCRVVKGLKRMTVGAIGARTSPFKTVRIDEIALQKHGITVETMDLTEVFARMGKLRSSDPALKAKSKMLADYTCWKGVPAGTLEKISRLGVVLDEIVVELNLDAMALRCWTELQSQIGISPCVLLGAMNDKGLATACEVDIGNAVAMHALRLASGTVATCLDWNNNYGDEEDKCILFHCGPVPQSMMTGKGLITDHAILANVIGEGCGFGCNTGRIAPQPFTCSSMLTANGKLEFYVGEGTITDDPIAPDFFGCAGVAEIPNLQKVLMDIGYRGHRHHVSLTPGHVAPPLVEAFQKYLGYNVLSV